MFDVGLFFACNDSKHDSKNGCLYVFATTRDRVKPYDSDAVSIVANFARLRRNEQEEILTETEQFLDERRAFVRSSHGYRIMRRSDVRGEVGVYSWRCRMDSLRREMGRLHTFIRQEKPYFVEGLIDPRDLFRIFIVQPRRLFPRLRAPMRAEENECARSAGAAADRRPSATPPRRLPSRADRLVSAAAFANARRVTADHLHGAVPSDEAGPPRTILSAGASPRCPRTAAAT